VDLLFDVARSFPNVPFRVVGWGPREDEYRESAPSNVQIKNWPEPGQLWHEFERASVFFLPSRAETFGMAILQAMAGGCAVVSTIPLPYEGAQVPVDDRDAMVSAIWRLWSDEKAARSAGARNTAMAATFTWQRFCAHLTGIYEELLQRESAGVLAAHAGEVR
jgi:glycosyltransferase involved in cell wall biosynthesis